MKISPIFFRAPSVGAGNIWIYFISHFFCYYCQKVLFTLNVSLLLLSLNDASVWYVDDEGPIHFSPEAEFISLS